MNMPVYAITLAFAGCTGLMFAGACSAAAREGPHSATRASPAPLVLSLQPVRDRYELKGAVTITLKGTIRNVSGYTIVISTRFAYQGPDITIHVTRAADGRPMRWQPPAPPQPLRTADLKDLKAGQYLAFDITFRDTDLFDTLAPGEYIVWITYANTAGEKNGKDAWRGELVSNKITLTMQQ